MTDNNIVFQSLNDKLTAMERLNDSVEDARIRQDMSEKIVSFRLQLKDIFGVPRLRRDAPVQDAETYCCIKARNSNGWSHDDACRNWVLTY